MALHSTGWGLTKPRSSTVASAPPSMESSHVRSGSWKDEQSARSTTLPVSTHASTQKPLTQDEFVSRIKTHALEKPKHALYPGENFSKLAQYLSRGSSQDDDITRKATPALFATLYLLQDPTKAKDFPSEDLQTPEDLQRVDERFCDMARVNRPHLPINEILFLRGFPISKWISTIGSYYRVDPEFFRRHLDFSLLPYQNWFSTPCLPSSSDNVVRIRVTTLARRRPEVKDIEKARELASDAMTPYIGRLHDFDANVGDSIVRKFSLHNKKYFSLEQDISICCCIHEGNWTVIAWLDSGKDLVKCRHQGPWMTTECSSENPGDPPTRTNFEFELISVIRNEPQAAIHSSQSTQKSRQLKERATSFHQSRALLNLDYGAHFKGLDVYDDPFYAIVPIFKHKALAETQFLNLIESVLLDDLESTRLAKPMGAGSGRSDLYLPGLRTSHSNFVFHRELLESHARCLRENLWTIKSRGGPEWPKSDNPKVIATAEVLRKDYEWLEERAKELSDLCDRGMKEIHDKATLAESVRSNELAEQVSKLNNLATMLSVIYIPLSFTTGFFGMNFAVFGQGHLKLWWWAVVSFPVLAISITIFFFRKIRTVLEDLMRFRTEPEANRHWTSLWA